MKKLKFLFILAVIISASVYVTADQIKWEQPPDETETGIDIRCDRNDQIPRMLADDFECTKTGPITDIHFWGSWLGDMKGKIDKIHLAIHGDIPASKNPTGYSMPDDNILW